jgi:hypothetical protein
MRLDLPAEEADEGDIGDRLQLEETSPSHPGVPSSAKPGALRLGFARAALPSPP